MVQKRGACRLDRVARTENPQGVGNGKRNLEQVKPARHSGFYTTFAPEELGPRKRRTNNMAKFTRAEIRNILGDACTEEIENRLVALHLGVVDPIKDDLTKYKADAEKLPSVQKELDDLKAAGDGGYKEKYEKEHSAFEAFKTDITAKESKAAKEKAVRAYFESKNITGANLDLAMRGCGEEMAALELDGEKIKDTKSLDALVDGTYKGLVSTTQTKGANPATPPANTGGGAMTKDQIMQIKDRSERRAAIAANINLFENKNGG
nr:MAG TPA: hypothetical protein [Caudoviricetes sp.]